MSHGHKPGEAPQSRESKESPEHDKRLKHSTSPADSETELNWFKHVIIVKLKSLCKTIILVFKVKGQNISDLTMIFFKHNSLYRANLCEPYILAV